MPESQTFGDVSLALGPDHVAVVELHRPPQNFFDLGLIRSVGDAYDAAAGAGGRAIVLASEGKHFCAGVDFTARPAAGDAGTAVDDAAAGTMGLYREAARLFRGPIPVVAAVQGAAVGGGLGLACSADFRVACPAARFVANFARLGFHQGFGLSVSLPTIIGDQRAAELLYSGRRLKGEDAFALGLCDRLVDLADVRDAAHELAAELAGSAPLAVRSIRTTLRAPLLAGLDAALEREAAEQDRLRTTSDWVEGVRAMAERRDPDFEGR